jgi:hypothetical protein
MPNYWYNYGSLAIGNYAFSGCISLTSITLPSTLTSIGQNAYANCKNLTIFAAASSKPNGWHTSWNANNRPVKWGYAEFDFWSCDSGVPRIENGSQTYYADINGDGKDDLIVIDPQGAVKVALIQRKRFQFLVVKHPE